MKDPREIIIRPLVTEKGMYFAEKTKAYPFEVHPDANKTEIKAAVQKLFGVKVIDVRTMNMRGKRRRRRSMRYGMTSSWKKVIVTISRDDTIEII